MQILCLDKLEKRNATVCESTSQLAATLIQRNGYSTVAITTSGTQTTPVFVFDREDDILDEHLTEDAYIMFDKIISYLHVSVYFM